MKNVILCSRFNVLKIILCEILDTYIVHIERPTYPRT